MPPSCVYLTPVKYQCLRSVEGASGRGKGGRLCGGLVGSPGGSLAAFLPAAEDGTAGRSASTKTSDGREEEASPRDGREGGGPGGEPPFSGGGGRSRSRRDSGQDGSGIFAIVAIVLMILAPILARLIYLAVSRKREYLADASAATFTRYPEGLASALEKISRAPEKLAKATSATAPMFIINPLKRTKNMAANATSTHPPIDERIRILRSMSGGSFADYDRSYKEVKGAKNGVIPGSALADDGAGIEAPPREKVSASQREIARQVDDLFYRKDGYQRIECPCGTVLKIPPDFKSGQARCPRCGTMHTP